MSKELNIENLEHAINRRVALKKVIEEAEKDLKSEESYIKSIMELFSLDEVLVGTHKVTYKEVSRTKFDKERFCTELGEQLYQQYCSNATHLELRIYH